MSLLVLAEVLAMTLWFSTSAVLPSLRAEVTLSSFSAGLTSSGVAAGFVFGTLLSALTGLADRVDPRRLFFGSALFGALANLSMLVATDAPLIIPISRLGVGMAAAGVYPVGMRMASTWASGDTGLLVGLLVGALTLGSASPHLVAALGGLDWRLTISTTSSLAVVAGFLGLLVKLGPADLRARTFRPRDALRAFSDPAIRLANLGYFGHMWELYAMWTWLPAFLVVAVAPTYADGDPQIWAKWVTFAAIAAGSAGALVAGKLADRLGRTTLTIAAMAVSGFCAAIAGFAVGAPPPVLVALSIVWGFAVVADSAQFSASIIELSPPDRVGTMLTVQTSVGFLLTMVTIHLVPEISERWGWQEAFWVLALGPLAGCAAMGALRRRPEATRLASGAR